ncbi:hypothetical protein, partial [Micromonospora orduensis]|uniref:hypothetical protein n=1 Tax=Micromonospora orduensis TaxID=1420891 RepID=UPI0033F07C1C
PVGGDLLGLGEHPFHVGVAAHPPGRDGGQPGADPSGVRSAASWSRSTSTFSRSTGKSGLAGRDSLALSLTEC